MVDDAAASSTASWFSLPSELLPTPLYLLGKKAKVWRTPALARAEEPAKRRATTRKAIPAPPFLPPDRALDIEGATPLRHGRVLLDGKVVVIPQKPEDYEQGFHDAEDELLLVELSGPDGAWLDDRDADSVYIGPNQLVPLDVVRQHVLRNVNVLARPAQRLKKLYQVVRPSVAPDYVMVLVQVQTLR